MKSIRFLKNGQMLMQQAIMAWAILFCSVLLFATLALLISSLIANKTLVIAITFLLVAPLLIFAHLIFVQNQIHVPAFIHTTMSRMLNSLRSIVERTPEDISMRYSTARPVALAVAVGNGDIEESVRQYLYLHEIDMKIYTVTQESIVSKGKFSETLKKVVEMRQFLDRQGATEVHLFYKGPVTLAMGIGAILIDWIPVTVYGYDSQTEQYRPTFILDTGGTSHTREADSTFNMGNTSVN